jgi:hypothetical protein
MNFGVKCHGAGKIIMAIDDSKTQESPGDPGNPALDKQPVK